MRAFNYTREEFKELIFNNTNYSFKNPIERIYNDSQSLCSFSGTVPSGGTVSFHNFEFNSSYHIEFSFINFDFIDSDLFKGKVNFTDFIFDDVGIRFKDSINKEINDIYNIHMAETNYFGEIRQSKHEIRLNGSIQLYFNKETNEYKGFHIKLTTFIEDKVNSKRKAAFINFSYKGGNGSPVEILVCFPMKKDEYKESMKFFDSIPKGVSVIQHWIGRCGGSVGDSLEKSIDGMEREDYRIAFNEMTEI